MESLMSGSLVFKKNKGAGSATIRQASLLYKSRNEECIVFERISTRRGFVINCGYLL